MKIKINLKNPTLCNGCPCLGVEMFGTFIKPFCQIYKKIPKYDEKRRCIRFKKCIEEHGK
jgi:hypothetical protein